MDNVLIAIDSSESSFWLAYYAMGLTRRVRARVSVLMVVDDEARERSTGDDEWIGLPEKRLESLLAEEHSDRAHVSYYVAHGPFEQEVLRFINENGTTKLFMNQPSARDAKSTNRFMEMLERISRQTNCHIEVVQKVSGHGDR